MAATTTIETRVLTCVDGPCRGTAVTTDAQPGEQVDVTLYVRDTAPGLTSWISEDAITYVVDGEALWLVRP